MKPDLQHLKAALESAEFTMEADPAAHPGLLMWSERTQQVIFSSDRQRPFDSCSGSSAGRLLSILHDQKRLEVL